MAQGTGRSSRIVGDYVVGKQIGAGSFSVVWHARHKVHGTEVAIKEIATLKLNKKLQESLMSEIFILKRINHPNIISLHDIIQAPGKIHLVLEYCKGGDLSLYIQRHGRVPEATAKHFMLQLGGLRVTAAGLQVLRDNNLIHRDLKPQNLLLSRNDEKAVLKIADFGFARSLQPRNLAETLCGSPLYMAPEIMQLQKYDAKADLWSVGAILYQFVTGKTPFTGNNQIQLLQNIMKSTELQFPSDSQSLSSECKDLCQKLLRRNPVERLTFEEFFNHPFLNPKQTEQDEPLRNKSSSRLVGGFSSTVTDPLRRTEENYQEDCLPFILDDDSSGPERRRNLTSPLGSPEQLFANPYPKVTDSLENIDQEYVLVSGPPMDVSSSSVNASKPSHSLFRSGSFPQESSNTITRLSAPMQIVGASTNSMCQIGSSGSQDSAPGTSHGSMDTGDEQPSTNCMTRVKSLQQYASAITELVNEKAASAMEGSPSQEASRYRRSTSKKHGSPDSEECLDENTQVPKDLLSQIESDFLREFEHAEELAKTIEPGNTEMPDAMETIFQSALAFGRHGGVEELMGDTESAAALYSKAVRLLVFLLVEGPSLILNPPFSLTNSDRYRLRNYIDILNNRQGYSRSQRMTLLKGDDSQGIFKEKF
ncbi:serine/threonine kinase family protein [Trifolium pratense]|uniref:Serine/threonine kinase family protein n=1 Tax=Trifolium pratense TaxID=57577 RepID=A0A2K3P0A1_TRIPR|nr:serine/threonine kinase family protein [Trifolium pratense]